MYAVSLSTTFVAQHYLTVPDPGPEGVLHSHRYGLELRVAGSSLDEYGYLVDIDRLEALLESFADRYRDVTLNDEPAFEGLNPSIEHVARIAATDFDDRLDAPTVERIAVTVTEDDLAKTTYSQER